MPFERSAREALTTANDVEMQPDGMSSAPYRSMPEKSHFGFLDPAQLAGERLANDPDWTPGCWLRSYWRMNRILLKRAEAIQSDRRGASASSSQRTGQSDPTIAGSLELLKKEVFSLCPMNFLYTGILLSTSLTVLRFTQPYVQGKLIDVVLDHVVKYKEGEEVDFMTLCGPLLGIIGLLMLGSYVSEVIVGILFAICGHTTVTRLRVKLFRNLVMQEIGFYDVHASGELSSRLINDSAALSSLTQFTTQTLLGAIVKFVGSLVAMFATHPWLALITTIITPVNTLIVRRTGKTVGYYGVVQNNSMANANAVAIEVLGNIRTVQSNVGEYHEAARFMERIHEYLRVIKFTVYFQTVLRSAAVGLSRLRTLIVVGYAMHQVVFGQLTIGEYTAFAQYIAMYEDGFKNLSDIWINFKSTITSTGKFVQLLHRVPEIAPDCGDEPLACTGSLTFEAVYFEYKSRVGHRVLSNVEFVAKPGMVIALVGESGAGKTTIGRLLMRYYDPTEGRILLDGKDYRTLNLRWLRAQFGFVEQEPVLFNRPIHHNIAYGTARGKSLEQVKEAAMLANAHGFISELQSGYETHPGEKAARISGGQKQRIAIARAVMRDPKVLLLDEATSALDSENEHTVQEALDNLMAGKTTFVIAHRLSTVIRATKILVLDKGSVIEAGSHVELVADDASKYASFMRHQFVTPLLQ